jgi:hypothetical protein
MGRAADLQKTQVCATRSKKSHEPVRGQAGLVDDRQQRSAFKVLVVKGQGDSACWLVRVLQNIMASRKLVYQEPRPR